MAKKKITYEEAVSRLEELVSQMETGKLPIDKLGETLQEAQVLIKYCRDKLYRVDEQIQMILHSEEPE